MRIHAGVTEPLHSIHPRDLGVIIRNTKPEDVSNIVDLQKISYPYLAPYGNIWRSEELESHLRIFPQGQFVAVEPDGTIVGSASTFLVSLNPEYVEHTWIDITADGLFTTHISSGDTLYLADVSTHPKHRHEGIGGMIIDTWKELVTELKLRRMIGGGRLFNYTEHADKMSVYEYVEKVMNGEIKDLVLSFELDVGFSFIKILPNYLNDVRSLNYAGFIEWLNPKYSQPPN
ncbi:MAG TPA: GNAT family N-acetyltransferase [Nitrososphaeraceae archaeon]|jgi:ribosomal protein S18 acetylase RimI-like enzyme